LKDPLFCLGLISGLFGLFFFVINPAFLKKASFSPENTAAALINSTSEVFAKNDMDSLFLGQDKAQLKETPELLFVQNDSLIGSSAPMFIEARTLAALDDSETYNLKREEIIGYTVEAGDELASIAEKFGISINTILWANNLTSASKLKAGDELIILPISGTLHFVEQGDSISKIAVMYQVNEKSVIAFNQLPTSGEVMYGDILVVPDGVMPAKKQINTSPTYATPVPSSYFLQPVPSSYYITQKLHWYNAIDFSNGACGGPIFSAAGGKVEKTGYSRIAGNFVRIIHPNKVVTYYGHLSKTLVIGGQDVYQGQVIGYIGNTGYTAGPTGCHLHFAVIGARNPFSK